MHKDGVGSSFDDPNLWLIPFLLSLPGFGVARYWRLRQNSLPLDRLLTQPLDSLRSFFPPSCLALFSDFYRLGVHSTAWQAFVQQHRPLVEQGVEVISHEDLRYPELLTETVQPPPVLYLRGSVEALSRPQIAFVGSRHATVNGQDTAAYFAQYLAGVGLGITSGLAQGIDAYAHQGALKAGGVTVAVMGTGIDHIYPSRHRALAADIVAGGGALVTEFAPATPPHSGNFPRRNRIISGLSLGVVVVEAALKSGSLITARYALEQNREVFAIPGSIHNPLSRGCHQLIREGATLVETAEDIAQELRGWVSPAAQSWAAASADRSTTLTPTAGVPCSPAQTLAADRLQDVSADEKAILNAVGFEVCSLDELAARLSLPIPQLLALLMQLELKGLISQESGCVLRLA